MEVRVHGSDGLSGKAALGSGCRLLGRELLRDFDVLGVRLRGTAVEATPGGPRGDSKSTVDRGGGKDKGCEAHDEQGWQRKGV